MSVIADPFHGTGEGSVLGFQRSTPCSPCVWQGETNVTLAAGLASAEAPASKNKKAAKARRTAKCLNIQRRRKEGSNLQLGEARKRVHLTAGDLFGHPI